MQKIHYIYKDEIIKLETIIDDIAQLINMNIFNGDITKIINQFPLYKYVIFNFKNHCVKFEIYGKEGNFLYSDDAMTFTANSFELENEIKTDLKNIVCKIWKNTPFPFEANELTYSLLVKMTMFTGYPTKMFYYSIPFEYKTFDIFGSFSYIERGMRNYENLIDIYKNSSLPNVKSVKRIMYENPEFFFYLNEIEKLLEILNDTNHLITLLKADYIYKILTELNISPIVFEFFKDYISKKPIKRLLNLLLESFYLFISYGREYSFLNEYAKKQEQKKWKKMKIRLCRYSNASSFFNTPLKIPTTKIKECSIEGYDFVQLKCCEDFIDTSNQLHIFLNSDVRNCCHNPVFIMKMGNKIVALIEIDGDKIVYAMASDYHEICENSEINKVYKQFIHKFHLQVRLRYCKYDY